MSAERDSECALAALVLSQQRELEQLRRENQELHEFHDLYAYTFEYNDDNTISLMCRTRGGKYYCMLSSYFCWNVCVPHLREHTYWAKITFGNLCICIMGFAKLRSFDLTWPEGGKGFSTHISESDRLIDEFAREAKRAMSDANMNNEIRCANFANLDELCRLVHEQVEKWK